MSFGNVVGPTPPCVSFTFVTPSGSCFVASTHRNNISVSKRPRRPAHYQCRPSMGVGYVPHDDDRPEGAPSAPTELTLAQQLLLKQYEEQVERMSTKECQDLALEIARQMMVKDNILRTMLKKEVDFGAEPPDPAEFEGTE